MNLSIPNLLYANSSKDYNLKDYYPGGMVMPDRSFSYENYGFGFNGKLKDDEVKGSGASYDYGFRIYDSRIGRFFSVDPITKAYPWYSPYQFAGNKPIVAIDIDGLEEWIVTNRTNADGTISTHITHYSDLDGGSVNIHATVHGKLATDGIIMSLNYDLKGQLKVGHPDAFTEAQQKIINDGVSKVNFVKQGTELINTRPFKATAPKDLNIEIYQPKQTPEPIERQIPKIAITGIGTAPAGQPLNFRINATFNGGSSLITNLNSLRTQLQPVVQFLNTNPRASLFVTGNVAGNATRQNWNSQSSDPNLTMGQLANNRAQSVVDLVRNMGLLNAKQAINSGTGFIQGGYSANGTVINP